MYMNLVYLLNSQEYFHKNFMSLGKKLGFSLVI